MGSRRCWARVDLGALRHNLDQVHRHAPGTRVMAALKANAYGHGAVAVVRALDRADSFAVATLAEAIELRQHGVTRPIVLLGGLLADDDLYRAVEMNLQLVIHDFHQLSRIEQAPRAHEAMVWIKLDSGMHRLGFAPEEVSAILHRLASLPRLRVQGWMTHFASADERHNPATVRQIASFRQALVDIGGARSLANSAGIVAWPDSHADWVRPGIMLYGASPLADRSAAEIGLKPVMTFCSRLLSIRSLAAGEPVGYGGRWVAPVATRVGVIAAGYGDGYPRSAPDGTPVLLRGRRVALAGRVSMDLLTVDLRGCDDAEVGDEVVLWGEGLPADEIATQAGTIAYELFCGLGRRVELEYLGEYSGEYSGEYLGS